MKIEIRALYFASLALCGVLVGCGSGTLPNPEAQAPGKAVKKPDGSVVVNGLNLPAAAVRAGAAGNSNK